MDDSLDVWSSQVRNKEKTHTPPAMSTHFSSPSSSASCTSSTSSSVTIRTPTSDSESKTPSSLHTFMTSIPPPMMERSSESPTSDTVGDLYQDRDDNPAGNSTYIILHQPTNLALMVIGGLPALYKVPVDLGEGHPLRGKCNWHWHCVETDGWLGFRNAAGGRYLGLNLSDGDTASDPRSGSYRNVSIKHGASERFICVRAKEDGKHEEGCGTPQQNKRGYIMCSLQIPAESKAIPRLVKARLKPKDSDSGSHSEEDWEEGFPVSMVWQDGQEGTVWRVVKV
ncbi:hypothetical protein GE21DRAFT_8703 [Neurospora crassa]|uniref:Uncharacterized protein n=2 Tax=Neurospora crassa TaxID=5141 RepID=Q7S6H0_NEUCR|nr:hypothetical protein NCU04735 [Neurospora crassa OR74A]EAA31134.1 hypothetical protein NCU04735 [Neurospora crassa OR74A]KHE83313.1 hypothetical protein GE21DRAFT_8703 [Neurospora crassa]CAE85557.1 putative protein [Neurospora crassa]|eukprot:XP_960370.1 hypothetical protein NCU04735 [Neurospora crassa OR74A]